MADLTRKKDRKELLPRPEPYWTPLAKRCHLGFRRGPDTWIARFTDRNYKKQYRALEGATEFLEAKKAAEAWFSQIAGAPVRSAHRGTVEDALRAYLKDLRRGGRESTAAEVEVRLKRIAFGDELATRRLEDLTRDDFVEWRERIGKGLLARSTNRSVRAVTAALNHAHRKLGYVGNPEAWRLERLPDDVEDEGGNPVFLSPEHRKAIICACRQAAGDFFTALQLTGARPKEIAAAKVSDFDGKTLRLTHRKGKPAKLRARRAVLSQAGIELFKRLSKGKPQDALLLTEDDGETQWRRHQWSRQINQAIAKCNAEIAAKNAKLAPEKRKELIPESASAYSFRHARISELLQIHGVDPLTAAQQTGTSLVMIEKHYLRVIPAALQEKLAAIKDG